MILIGLFLLNMDDSVMAAAVKINMPSRVFYEQKLSVQKFKFKPGEGITASGKSSTLDGRSSRKSSQCNMWIKS